VIDPGAHVIGSRVPTPTNKKGPQVPALNRGMNGWQALARRLDDLAQAYFDFLHVSILGCNAICSRHTGIVVCKKIGI
jgi:hypothetical protein